MDSKHEDVSVTRGGRFVQWLQRYQLGVLIVGTIIIAIITTSIGLALYSTSGTAQVDLSRPGYEGVGEIADRNADAIEYVEFSASGPVDESALDEFDSLYRAQTDNIQAVDAFGGDPLSPTSLGIDDKAGE